MGKYFKDAAGLAAFLSFVVAVIVVIAVIVGGFAMAMLGLFIVFAPICFVVLAPIRRYASRNHDFLESLLSKVEDKEEELRAKVRKKSGSGVSRDEVESIVRKQSRDGNKPNVKL